MKIQLMEKIGSGLTKILDKMRRIDSIKIDCSEWSKTDKKAEIVDLWHQAEKARRGSNDYNMRFEFARAEESGVEFYLYNANLGMANIIGKKLTGFGVKHEAVDCDGEKAVAG